MSERFDLIDTPLSELKLIQRKPRGDDRGYLERLYCANEFHGLLVKGIVQINHTLTKKKGSVRGLHFQVPPHAEAKIVSCLRGEIFDVAVDLRRGSPTFLRWHAEVLSGDNHKALFIPAGFAHGFQTLTDDCDMLYFHSEAYDPGTERGLSVNDPGLAIHWPLPVANMSARDTGHPSLTSEFAGVTL